MWPREVAAHTKRLGQMPDTLWLRHMKELRLKDIEMPEWIYHVGLTHHLH